MSKESVVDASRPNAGRIYDYILGGSHNFEVDRQAALLLGLDWRQIPHLSADLQFKPLEGCLRAAVSTG